MLNQVEGSIKAIQEIAELPFFIRWKADDLRQTKMPIEMRIRNLMILCETNHHVSRLCDSLLSRDVGGQYLRKLWEVKVTATSHRGLCEGLAAATTFREDGASFSI